MPFLFAFNAANFDSHQRILVNVFFWIIATGALLNLQGKIRHITLGIVSVLAAFPNIVVMTYLIMDNTIFKSTDFWCIFDTNFDEATGFFTTVPLKAYIWCFVYVVLLLVTLRAYLRTYNKKETYLVWQVIVLLILLAICLILPFRAKVPMVDFYKSFYKYQMEKIEVREFYETRTNLKLDAECVLPNGKKTIVVVIGESQNQTHMGLYGYYRSTNPKLSTIKDELTIYTDVCAPATLTLVCMKQILTFTNYENPDMYKKEASIVEIARDAGYKTIWIDNQGDTHGAFMIDTYTPTSYRTIAHLCDDCLVSDGLDSIVVTRFANALKDTAENKFIFLHLIGNHFPYETRFEKEYQYWTGFDDIQSPFVSQMTDVDKQKYNNYDNATLYNDMIMYSIIDELKKQSGMSALIYFSDHGEEVYDYACVGGRSLERKTPSMCEVPLILWMNQEYQDRVAISIDSTRPICTDNVIYALMDLGGLKYKLYDETKSFLSNKYQPYRRLVQGVDIDSIKTYK